jgi:hypothetical protein
VLSERTLVPEEGAMFGEIRFDDWLSRFATGKQVAARKPA